MLPGALHSTWVSSTGSRPPVKIGAHPKTEQVERRRILIQTPMYTRYNGYLIRAHNRHPTRKHNSTNSERYRTTTLASGEKEAPLTRSNRSPNWLLTQSKKNQSKEYCLVCTVDVKNAFNLANWNLVLQALHRIGIS